MDKNSDKELIKAFINFCIRLGFNQTRMAEAAGRSRGWASLLVHGEIKSLNFDTRNKIKGILGIS
jgi:hypothetical protein